MAVSEILGWASDPFWGGGKSSARRLLRGSLGSVEMFFSKDPKKVAFF